MFRNDTIESEADRRRKVSRPEVTEGKLIPAIRAINATTISASSNVIPRSSGADVHVCAGSPDPARAKGRPAWTPAAGLETCPTLFIRPALDVGIRTIAARLSVGAQRNNVGFLAVIAGIFVLIRTVPRIHRNVLGHVRTGPIGD